MSELNNMDIWDKVCTTDTNMTKKGTTGARLTSINGVYMVRQATEVFGPVGLGWGWRILEERYDETVPLVTSVDGQFVMGQNHTLIIELWVKDHQPIPSFGHTKYRYKTNNGIMCDEEAPKKSLTDAIKKGLSFYGVCADVFMGQFDDHEYIEEQKNKEALEKADNKAEEEAKQIREYEEWRDTTLKLINESVSESMLKGVFTEATRKANARQDKKALQAFTKAKDVRKAELEAKK